MKIGTLWLSFAVQTASFLFPSLFKKLNFVLFAKFLGPSPFESILFSPPRSSYTSRIIHPAPSRSYHHLVFLAPIAKFFRSTSINWPKENFLRSWATKQLTELGTFLIKVFGFDWVNFHCLVWPFLDLIMTFITNFVPLLTSW